MRIHAALVTALIVAGIPLALADPLNPDASACNATPAESSSFADCAAQASVPETGRSVVILMPGTAILGDVLGARGPDPHSRELREIAVATATGNIEKAEIITRELHQFGVSRETVREFVDQAQLHTGSTRPAKRRFFVSPSDLHDIEPGWENSQ
jgi:hypothetical protein